MKAKLGRPAEPDKSSIEYAIAGLVAQFMSAERVSLEEARLKVSEDLETSIDTVKRACRIFRVKPQSTAPTLPVEAHVAAMVLEMQLQIDPGRYFSTVERVRSRLKAIKVSRGK